ncbi:MAG: RICIN domain-containing protein [Oscillospiraceae bacterium]
MKKVISFIGALVLLSNNIISPVVYADTDSNLNILLSKKVILGITEPNIDIMSKCDVNIDNTINVLDVISLKNRYLTSSDIDLSKYELVSGYDNLYNIMEVSNSSENSYVSIDMFGNNLLTCNRFADEMCENVSYDLSIYDINNGNISYTLENIYFDEYYIVDNHIMLWDLMERTISIYDETLNLINTYDISSIFNEYDWLSLYTCNSTSIVYISNNDTNEFYKIYLDDNLKYDTFDFPYKNTYIYNVTLDGKVLGYGLNKQTLKNEIVYWDLEKNSAEYAQPNPICNSVVDDTFLSCVNYDNSIWSIQSINQNKHYFEIKDAQAVELDHNKNIISSVDDGSNKYINIYDIVGNNKASINLNDNLYYNVTQISNTDYYLMVNHDSNGKYNIVLWDTSNSDKVENLKEVAECDITPSMIGDIEELSELYVKAEDIANDYGINIYIGDTIISEISDYSFEQCTDVEIVTESLDKLEEILSCYPDNFFTQLYTGNLFELNFYLTGSIIGKSSDGVDYAGGVVTERDNSLTMSIDCYDNSDWESILNHEISHLIDSRISTYVIANENAVFNEDTWNSYNPNGFEYACSYKDYWNNPCDYDYFIRDYSTTFPTEDRAELFSYAMQCYLNPNLEDYFISANTGKGKKLNYFCESIRDSFDTSNWDDIMPWEQVLYSNKYEDTFVFPFENGGIYTIQNVYSGKCLNVDYGKDVNSTNVYQWTKDGSTEQEFRLCFWDKVYTISAMCSSDGYDKILNIVHSNGNVISGGNVDIYEPCEDISQHWLLVEVEKDVYKIVPRYNTDLALSVCGNSNGSADGTTSTSNGNVFVSTYTGDDTQKWVFTKISD